MNAQSVLSRDLTVVRQSDFTAVQAVFSAAWLQWCAAWGGGEGWGDLESSAWSVASASEQPDVANGAWVALEPQHVADASAWVRLPAAGVASLAGALIGRRSKAALPEHDWSRQAADAALEDLNVQLLRALRGPRAATPYDAVAATEAADQATQARTLRSLCAPLSGALLITESTLGLQWLLGRSAYLGCVNTSQAASRAQRSAPVQSLLGSMTTQRVRLELGLGEVDISMRDLLDLQLGDVVQFPLKLTDSLVLSACQAQPVRFARCQLGQQQGQLAVQVSAAAA